MVLSLQLLIANSISPWISHIQQTKKKQLHTSHILNLDTTAFTGLCTTVKFDKHKHKKAEGITRGILNSIRFRDKLHLKLRKTHPTSAQYQNLKTNLRTYNKILKKNIREAKMMYYQERFSHFEKDIKNTWKTISSIISKTENNNILPEKMQINNNIVTDPLQIANEFNHFFQNIGPHLASNINAPQHKSFTDYLDLAQNPEFSFKNVTEVEIHKIIDRLKPKTSVGIDGISVKLLKEIKNIIIKPLTLIVNQSLISGTFPKLLKIAKITPIYKSNDKDSLTNYRPISILPAMSKIFEKVMHIQLHKHLSQLNYIILANTDSDLVTLQNSRY